LSTPFQQLELIKAENPKLSQHIDALSAYIRRLWSQGQREIEPYLASQALHTSEAFTLGLLKLMEDSSLLEHSYNIYCGKQRAFLTSVREKKDIPSVIYCKFCEKEHCRPDDLEVELVFKIVDSAWPSVSLNAAAR
jgi:hypothetical protein